MKKQFELQEFRVNKKGCYAPVDSGLMVYIQRGGMSKTKRKIPPSIVLRTRTSEYFLSGEHLEKFAQNILKQFKK